MNRDTIKMLAMATMLVNHISHLFHRLYCTFAKMRV